MILIIVAHPDDETLWFSGGIKYFLDKNIYFGIIALTNASNHIRSEEFSNFINMIGVPGFMLDLQDGGTIEWSCIDLESRLYELFEAKSIKCSGIITHSPFGEERAHRQHKNANRALRFFAAKNEIPFGFFSCHYLWTRKPANMELIPNSISKPFIIRRIKSVMKFFAVSAVEVLVQLMRGRLIRRDFPVDSVFLEKCLACYPSQLKYPYTYQWIHSRIHLMYGEKKLIGLIETPSKN